MLTLDEQLAEVTKRRDNCLDLLCRALIEIDSCSQRIDVLLDRRTTGDGPIIDDIDQMT